MGKHSIFRTVMTVGVVVTVAALGCLSGCAGEKISESRTAAVIEDPAYEWGNVSGRTISVWGRATDLNRGYMTRAFKRYEELTGNRVRTVEVLPEEIEGRVAEALEDEDAGLDVLLYYGGTNIESFDPDKNFYDFSDAAWVEDLTNMSINQAIYHGKVIGLPHWEASVSGTLYNKKIFEKLDIAPPQTQEEFWQACRVLKEHGLTPLYLPGAEPTMLLYQFPLDTIIEKEEVLEALNGGDLLYKDMPDMHTVVEWYCSMAENGYLGTDYMANDWDGMSGALESGRYGMMLCWDTWLYTDFKGDPADFGLMPAFMGVPEKGTFEGANLALMLVNRNGKQVDAALDLISFMADPYNYNYAFDGIYTAPVFRKQMASISTPQYVEAAGWIEENYHDSTAWMRVKGFSQSDASCILECMKMDGYTVEQCLEDMDVLRLERMQNR